MNNLLSIVVCSHNAEKTISRTLNSIGKFLPTSVKVIVVDDGSTDRTCQLIREFQKNNPQIYFIEQENSGSAAARNRGMALVDSEYVMFCDSDDEIKVFPWDSFLQAAKSKKDLVFFDYELVQRNGGIVRVDSEFSFNDQKNLEIISDELRSDLMRSMGFWRYAYRVDFLSDYGIRFIGELEEVAADFFVLDDYFFLLSVLSNAKTIEHIPEVVYRYYANQNATMNRFKKQSCYMARAALIQIKELSFNESFGDKSWYTLTLRTQLIESFTLLRLVDALRFQWSFRRSFWTLNKLCKSCGVKNTFKTSLVVDTQLFWKFLRTLRGLILR